MDSKWQRQNLCLRKFNRLNTRSFLFSWVKGRLVTFLWRSCVSRGRRGMMWFSRDWFWFLILCAGFRKSWLTSHWTLRPTAGEQPVRMLWLIGVISDTKCPSVTCRSYWLGSYVSVYHEVVSARHLSALVWKLATKIFWLEQRNWSKCGSSNDTSSVFSEVSIKLDAYLIYKTLIDWTHLYTGQVIH